MIKSVKKVFVLGSGSFGTAMANLWAAKGLQVTLWGRSQDVIDEINTQKTNSKYLPGSHLQSFSATTDLKKLTSEFDYVVLAIPTQNLRSVLVQIKNQISENQTLINLAKGLEKKTLLWPHQIFLDVLGEKFSRSVLTLSGPTFSKELLDNHPTAAVIAGLDQDRVCEAQADLSLPWFRLYSSQDQLGVEIAGAIKNIYAIAVGVLEGLGLGHNSKSSFITRCLAEMIRFGVALGAEAETFSGLSGVGDLILTCTGHLSRNRSLGVRLGQGESLDEILKSLHTVTEGVMTAESVHDLVLQNEVLKNLELPNLNNTYKVLHEGLTLPEALQALLNRPLKSENEG